MPAVKDFNLAVKDGEFIVFVGPSGCGKSTTLRMLAGLEEITSGDLYIDDVRINDKEPKDRDIAMVFQSYALYPHMNVYENMAFALKLRKVPKDEIENAYKMLPKSSRSRNISSASLRISRRSATTCGVGAGDGARCQDLLNGRAVE